MVFAAPQIPELAAQQLLVEIDARKPGILRMLAILRECTAMTKTVLQSSRRAFEWHGK